jgi:hypothetical protein
MTLVVGGGGAEVLVPDSFTDTQPTIMIARRSDSVIPVATPEDRGS